MITRRSLLISSLLTTALALLPAMLRPARAQQAGGAAGFIQTTATRLTDVVNGPGSDADKQQRMRGIIDSSVDVDDVARFCLGRFWRIATPAQQTEFTRLFHAVLVNNITSKLGEFKGVKVSVGGTKPREDGQVVSTTVDRPGNPPTNVDWLVRTAGGAAKIVDVVAEGTSLRLTQRSDYAAFVTRNNNSVDALLKAMRAQVQQSG